MGRRNRHLKRTPTQAAADRAADELAQSLGQTLERQRLVLHMTQKEASATAGISPSTWSYLEVGRDGRTSLATWQRAAMAVNGSLRVYIQNISGASQPRDAVHLRNQETVMRLVAAGGWKSRPEVPLDRDLQVSRMADVVLQRQLEWALVEIIDWFGDVGAASRAWHRRLDALERHAIARMRDDRLPTVSGVWVVRATQRNRQILAQHGHFFRALHEASGRAWLAALTDESRGMPAASGLLWVSVSGDRLFVPRFGSPR